MTFDPTKGSQRIALSEQALRQIEAKIPQLRDDRRRRPLYFDGRFLAARDLTREQDYFLSRQADLARAGGFGVVSGLLVTEDPASPGRVRIQPGHGVTPSGELVVVSAQMSFDVAQASVSEAIRVRMGVQRVKVPTARVRSGLYVLALRPVEYEANPVAQYPTTLDGERSVHNGDIVEATAVTLIPYPDLGEPTEARFRRAHAAKEIFVDRVNPSSVTDALPIAMVALDDRGRLLWVDSHLVRREVGAEAGDILGVSGAPLALREAFMLQFDDHLHDLLATQHGGIVAAQHFLALPPAGPMPKSAIDRQLFAQRFFPAEVDVDVSVVPSDELSALLEEARLLPPIDLTDAAELASTSVLVLVPVDREKLTPVASRLVGVRRKLPAAAPNLLAKKRPLERLAMLPLARQELVARVPVTSPEDAAWRDLLDLDRANDTVWYVRRRNLSAKPSVVGEIEGRYGDDLLELSENLAGYGITEEDARRVHPWIWQAAREHVLALPEPLYRAAAIVELAQVPRVAKADAPSWARHVSGRFAIAENDARAMRAFFTERRPVTHALVRSGMLSEVADVFGEFAVPGGTFQSWSESVRALEQSTDDEALRTELLRKKLFEPLANRPQLPMPAERLMRVPADVLARYGLDKLTVDVEAWKVIARYIKQAESVAPEGARLLAADALIELASRGPLSDTDASKTVLDILAPRRDALPAMTWQVVVALTATGPNKINVIKAIREVSGLGLKEAKDLADAGRGYVKLNLEIAEGAEAKRKLVEAGAEVAVEPEDSLVKIAPQLARTGDTLTLARKLPRDLNGRIRVMRALAAAAESGTDEEKISALKQRIGALP